MSASKTLPTPVPLAQIEARILIIRGQKVMIDADLAHLYGVPTKALNQAIKRNAQRFPPDFMFPLTAKEKTEVVTNCDHLTKLKFSKSLPFAFTEHGAIQAANVLASPEAVDMGVYVVRAFVRLREMVASNKDLEERLDDLENKIEQVDLRSVHDTNNGKVLINLNEEGTHVKIRVQDNGKGMSASTISKLTERVGFTEGKENGHGLGMEQVWDMLETNSGELIIQSKLGEGTSFELIFPKA